MTFGLMRVKNESRWIERVIRSIQPVCNEILVLDDHSTDPTPEICERLGCKVFRSQFENINETRDKDFLLQKVWEAGASLHDYCLMVDGDEALHPDDVQNVRDAMAKGVLCGKMHIVYLWDREDQVRTDRWYKEFRRPSLFRLFSQRLTFKKTAFGDGANFHCSSAPAQLLSNAVDIPVRLLHFGYLHKEDRIRKYHWYNQVDPNNAFEDQYRHMVIGDIFPAESSFRHAGPLKLEPLH